MPLDLVITLHKTATSTHDVIRRDIFSIDNNTGTGLETSFKTIFNKVTSRPQLIFWSHLPV